jgi:hypothetical protein
MSVGKNYTVNFWLQNTSVQNWVIFADPKQTGAVIIPDGFVMGILMCALPCDAEPASLIYQD